MSTLGEQLIPPAREFNNRLVDVNERLTPLEALGDVVLGKTVKNYEEGKKLLAGLPAQIIDDENYCISEKIPCVDWSGYIAFDCCDNTKNDYRIVFYDENDVGLHNFILPSSAGNITYRYINLDTQITAGTPAYVRFSFKRGEEGQVQIRPSVSVVEEVLWKATVTVTLGLPEKIDDAVVLIKQKADKTELGTYVNKGLMQKCELVHQEASPNRWNPEAAVYGMVHTNGNVYTGGSYDAYCYESIGAVNEGDVITGYRLTEPYDVMARIAAYDSNGNVVSSAGAVEARTYTVPAGIASLTITVLGGRSNSCMILVNADEAPTEFMPYGEETEYYLATDEFLPQKEIVLNIPRKIYAAVGIETNIYFDNLTENADLYDWDVTCSKGMQLERGYRITPTSSDVGSYPITIKASLSDNTYRAITATLIVSEIKTSNPSVIIMGDSTTYNGIAVNKLHEDMSVQTLGTMGTSPNNHEGRSGWKLSDYFTKASIVYPSTDPRGTILNPFYNPTTETFDAAYYFANSGVAKPDYFIINMGINDMFGYGNDEACMAELANVMARFRTAVQSIIDATTTTKVCVCLTIPPNHSQDAFGKAYACNQTRNRYKRNNVFLVKAIIEEFDNRESERIYVIPINGCLDTIYNMGMETLPVNARNTSITYQSPITNGGVHPVESGYWQIADVYTAFFGAN